MNIVNKFMLNTLLAPSSLYEKMDVDTSQLRAILTVKLTMDDRRLSGIQQIKQQAKQKRPRYATLTSMFFSALLGALFLYAFFFGQDYTTKLTVFFSLYIFIMASMLIADFTTVLIDVRDNLIILPKPVSDRTFLMSRILHILIHISKLVFPMTLPGMVYMWIETGFAGWLVFSILILCATLFTIFLINAMYVIVLKVTTPERFKNIISYFQIFCAILFYGGYQLIPRLIDKTAAENYSVASSKIAWLTPPYWFAAAWQYFKNGQWNSTAALYAVWSVLLPAFSIYVVIRFFAPSFNRKLAMISGSEGAASAPPATTRGPLNKRKGYLSSLAKWFTKRGVERMAFLHTWKITNRSREFKMKVYPSIGYVFILILVFVVRQKSSLTMQSLHEKSGVFIMLIYMCCYSLIMALYQLPYSEKFKAGWIYFVTPVQIPGNILSGSLKALTVKMYTPMAIAASGIAVFFGGLHIIPNILLALANQMLIMNLIAYLVLRELPFSMPQPTDAKGSNFLRGIFSLVLPFAVGGLQFLIYNYTYVVLIVAVLSASAAWLVMGSIKDRNWSRIRTAEYE